MQTQAAAGTACDHEERKNGHGQEAKGPLLVLGSG